MGGTVGLVHAPAESVGAWPLCAFEAQPHIEPPHINRVSWRFCGQSAGRRFSQLHAVLQEHIQKHRPDFIVKEEPILKRGKFGTSLATARALLGYDAIVEMVCAQHGIPVRDCKIQTARQMFTGDGTLRKDDKARIIDEAERRGFVGVDEHQADALAVLDAFINTAWPNRRRAA
ncbi:MAG: hypothetical protein QNJ92_06785 [Alphaproteobacteria bacterium]|nr:hypothetical protein [Alphaproteobacteria bacterium]